MRWNPSQTAGQVPRQSDVNSPNSQSRSDADPLFARRENAPVIHSPLGLDTNVSQQSPMPVSIGTPFTFAQVAADSPAFAFSGSMGMAPVIADQQSPFLDISSWTPKLPLDPNGNLLVSPGLPVSTPNLQHSPDAYQHQTGSSASGHSSPEPARAPTSKKRKSFVLADTSDKHPAREPVKKTSHNMIEKRYRTNLNDKIAVLRDCVPSLRVMTRSGGEVEEYDDAEDLEGLTPAHKLNKATILSKATEYIRHLEKRNKQLCDEVVALKQRVDAYEKMAMTGASFGFSPALSTPDGPRFPGDPFDRTANGMQVSHPAPQGLIPVPADIANMRSAAMSQPHYSSTQQPYGMYTNPPPMRVAAAPVVNGRHRGGIGNKIMVGALTGLMIIEGFRESEKSGDEPEGRGLFAMPLPMLGRLAGSNPTSLAGHSVFHFLKISVLLTAVAYLILPLLDAKPQPKKKKVDARLRLSPVPSLASPVELRRKAWLTAIQTVWVPQHSFILEAAALVSKTLKLSTRKLIGWQGYSFLTGITMEQETARVKAWEIALDAQLTGGDAEISTSRLLLTLLASGTLPSTPARLMLRALHIRLMLWHMSRAGYRQFWFWLFDGVNKKMAQGNWTVAREENRLIANGHAQDSQTTEALPNHLAALLEQHPNDALIDNVIQRAYNLAWNKPTSHDAEADGSMDSVVEDFAISSPLDALASWFSSFILGRVLIQSLSKNAEKEDAEVDLNLAICTAPPGSQSHVRILVAKAILVDGKRREAIAKAFEALPSSSAAMIATGSGRLLNIIGEGPVPDDVQAALTMAKCILLATTPATNANQAEARERAKRAVNGWIAAAGGFTILSLVATFKCMELFAARPELLASTKPGVERMANALRLWIGHSKGANCGIPSDIRAHVVTRCLAISRSLVGIRELDSESDAGYASADD